MTGSILGDINEFVAECCTTQRIRGHIALFYNDFDIICHYRNKFGIYLHQHGVSRLLARCTMID